MSDHFIKSSWTRFFGPRGRIVVVGRAAAARAAGEASSKSAAEAPPRVEGKAVERERVAAWEDEGGATKPSS